jgi:hypothetical protein
MVNYKASRFQGEELVCKKDFKASITEKGKLFLSIT